MISHVMESIIDCGLIKFFNLSASILENLFAKSFQKAHHRKFCPPKISSYTVLSHNRCRPNNYTCIFVRLQRNSHSACTMDPTLSKISFDSNFDNRHHAYCRIMMLQILIVPLAHSQSHKIKVYSLSSGDTQIPRNLIV